MRILNKGKKVAVELSEKEFEGLLLILKKLAELYDGKIGKVTEPIVPASN